MQLILSPPVITSSLNPLMLPVGGGVHLHQPSIIHARLIVTVSRKSQTHKPGKLFLAMVLVGRTGPVDGFDTGRGHSTADVNNVGDGWEWGSTGARGSSTCSSNNTTTGRSDAVAVAEGGGVKNGRRRRSYRVLHPLVIRSGIFATREAVDGRQAAGSVEVRRSVGDGGGVVAAVGATRSTSKSK